MASKRTPTRLDASAIVVLAFVSIFGFIGLSLLFFLWGPGDSFPRPPFFFRVFASFIAGGFMLIGFGIPLSAIARLRKGETPFPPRNNAPTGEPPSAATPGRVGYTCPNCGADLAPGSEVSPSGDAKCTYCHRWWNIHRAG